MPFVVFRGRLRRMKRPSRPGRPDIGLPSPEEPVDPDYGIDEGGEESIWPGLPEEPLPEPPPGIWPPPVPGHPIQPLPPGEGPPPGAIWPPVNPPGWKPSVPVPPPTPGQPLPTKKLWVLAFIPGYGFKYIVVDLNAIVWPEPPAGPQPK